MVLKLFQYNPKMVPKWSQMVPNGSPPIPIPGVSKSLLPGSKTIRKHIFFMIFNDFYENARGLIKNKKKHTFDDFLSCFMKSHDFRY